MKKVLAIILALTMLLGATALAEGAQPTTAEMSAALLEAAKALPKSESLYFENGLEITGMGVHFNNHPLEFDGCYYFPAIQAKTGAKIVIDWRSEDSYGTQVATTLASGKLPDILQAGEYGVMNLVNEGAVVALDEYLDLIPNVVEAVGEDRMAAWRQPDGHIYTIPTIVNVPGSQSVMVRQDWLDALGMKEPTNWDEWMALWRGIKEKDLNGNGDPNDEIPLALEQGNNGERSMASLLNAFGIRASSDCQFCVLDDGTYTMVYEHPRYREFLQTVQDMYKEGLIDPEFATRTQAELFTAMDSNLVGTAMTWAERAKLSTYANREGGDEDALWTCVAPITGPYGDQITQERNAVTPLWCITTAAKEAGKVEDILRVFNWNFSKEGNDLYNYGIEGVSYDVVDGQAVLKPAMEEAGKVEDILRVFNWNFSKEGNDLYNYGIEGVSYDVVDGQAVLKPAMVANGFVDYRLMGCEYEPFGGVWQTSAFTQCLFAGKDTDSLDDASASFYSGLSIVNNGHFYPLPQTLETDAYVEFRAELITTGVCVLRDQAVAGQLTVDEFFTQYESLKAQGLQEVLDAGAEAYALLSGAK